MRFSPVTLLPKFRIARVTGVLRMTAGIALAFLAFAMP